MPPIYVPCGYENPGRDAGGDLPAVGTTYGVDAANVGRFGFPYRNLNATNHEYDVKNGAPTGLILFYLRWRMRLRAYPTGQGDFFAIGRGGPLSQGSIHGVIDGSTFDLYAPNPTWAAREKLSAFFPGYMSVGITLYHWYECMLWWQWGINVCHETEPEPCTPPPFSPTANLLVIDSDNGYTQAGWAGTASSFPSTWRGQCDGSEPVCTPKFVYTDTIQFGQSGLAGSAANGLAIDVDSVSVEVFVGDEHGDGLGWEISSSALPVPGDPLPYLFTPTRIPLNETISAVGWVIDTLGGPASHLALNDLAPVGVAEGCLKSTTGGSVFEVSIGTPVSRGFLDPSAYGVIVSIYFVSCPIATHTVTLTIGGSSYTRSVQTFGAATWVRVVFPDRLHLDFSTFPNTSKVSVSFTKDAGIGAVRIQCITVQIVGEHDYTPAPPVTSNVSVATGEYVGNGLTQSVACGIVPGWIHTDPIANGIGTGCCWWDTMITGTDWARAGQRSNVFVPTPTGFDVVGNDPSSNQAGITYRWFAIQDGPNRLLYRGAFSDYSVANATLNSGKAIVPATFGTTRSCWAQREPLQAVGGLNGGYYLGPSMSSPNSSPLAASALVTTAIRSLPLAGSTWVAGSDLTDSSRPQTAFTAWSTDFLTTVLWAVASYTGDGNPTQTVALTLGGRGPGWVMVVPGNTGNRYLSTASLPVGTSQNLSDGVYSANAILTMCNNAITVGSDLNTIGVLYQVLAIADPSWVTDGTPCGGHTGSTTPAPLVDTGDGPEPPPCDGVVSAAYIGV